MIKSKNTQTVTQYRKLKGIAQHIIKSSARESWQTFCSTLNSQTKLGTVWKFAKKMNGTSTRCKNITLNDNGILLDKDKEKAELFADSFSKISSNDNYSASFKAHKIDIETNHRHYFKNDETFDEHTPLNEPLTLPELRRAIRDAKKAKIGRRRQSLVRNAAKTAQMCC